MRVAYVSNDLGVPIFGRKGCSIHVQEIVRAFLRQGSRVDLFSPNCTGSPPEGFDSVSVHPLPSPKETQPRLREAASLALHEQWINPLQQGGPFDLVYERYSLWSRAGMEYARQSSIPSVLEVNAPLIEEQSRYRVLVDRAGAEQVAQEVFGAARVIVAVSEEVAADVRRYPQAEGKVHVVPNGVDAARFSLPPTARASKGSMPFTVGFVGGLKPWHGLSVLVAGFAGLVRNLPEARLLIVGDGPEREPLEKQLADVKLLDQVTFTGAVPHGKVPELLAMMDVAVAPYPDVPGFYFSPLKLYEYMAAGLAVVASNIGQVAQVLRSGFDGLLVPPGDATALAGALAYLAHRPMLREQLGAAAQERVRRECTWDKVVVRILQLTGCRPIA